MYIIPQPYKCPRCSHECLYGPHDQHPAPAFIDGPICPICWGTFIQSVAPLMVPCHNAITQKEASK